MNEGSEQVAVTVAGYIAKTLSGRTNSTDSKLKLIANEKFNEHDEYLNLLPYDGLNTPSAVEKCANMKFFLVCIFLYSVC